MTTINKINTNPFAVQPIKPRSGQEVGFQGGAVAAGNPFAVRNGTFNGQAPMADAPGGLGDNAIYVSGGRAGRELFITS